MRILLLGGTAWVGRALADAAMAQKHDVTCLARSSSVPAGAQFVRADRDVDGALAALPAGRWDAVIDVATEPGHVRRAVRDLSTHAEQYVFVSSCNVYASLATEGIDEDAPLCDPLTTDMMTSREDYGPAKVACERTVLAGFGAERATIVRPGLIGGPADPTGRSTYWPLRFARPSNPQGRVLVPDAREQPTSVIDVRDLATWMITLVERNGHGIFNAAGDVSPLAVHLDTARDAAGHTGPLASASRQWLGTQGVASWSGPKSLPLWVDDPQVQGIGALSNARAKNAGLTLRPLEQTLADTLSWAARERIATVAGAGLTDSEERTLLTELDAS